jgi:hypothetical protein
VDGGVTGDGWAVVATKGHEMSGTQDIKDIRYQFTCISCKTSVLAALPDLREHGWLDISTHGNPNQWLCPSCGRGFTKTLPQHLVDSPA